MKKLLNHLYWNNYLHGDLNIVLLKFLADARPFGPVRCMSTDPYLCPVQRLRSDNGGEFVSNQFADTLMSNSIKHEKSAPYSPHQNGTVERGWRTMFDMARCLLVESKLPKKFWTYAVMTAVYIRNRCYHQRTKQTPYFLLTGRKPNLSNMHVFGTVCYPYNIKKTKLDNRSVKGIFLGYDKGSPAYIVYYPNSGKVLTHRVVTFTDNPSPVRQGNEIINNNLWVHDDDDDFPGYVPPQPADIPPVPIVETEVIDVDAGDVVGDAPAAGVRRNPPRDRQPPPHLVENYELEDATVDSADYVQDFDNITFCFRASIAVPKTYKQAMSSDDSEKWKDAMDEEMKSLHKNNTYSLVPLPKNKQVVGGRWVYSVKVEPSGKERYKARYVAQGFKQVHGSDYFETFAPTDTKNVKCSNDDANGC